MSLASKVAALILPCTLAGIASNLWVLPAKADTEGTPSVAEERGLWVVVEADAAGLDPFQVRQAVQEELQVRVYAQDSASAVGTLMVTAASAHALVMRYQGKDGRRHERTVSLPQDPERRLETVALVAGNLARDETGQLIAELRPPVPPRPPSEPPSGEVSDGSEVAPAAPSAATAEQEPEARPPPAKAAPPRTKPKPTAGAQSTPALVQRAVNLSLFHPLSLHPDSHNLEVQAEFGLAYSNVGRVRGGAFTVFVSRLAYGFHGVQFASLVTLSDGESRGMAGAGLFSQQRGSLRGVLAAGVATHSSGTLLGGNAAGVATWHQGPLRGFQASGAVSHAHDVEGIQLAGVLNLARDLEGGMVSGVANAATQGRGIMLSGVANVVRGPFRGGQVAGLNFAPKLRGLQLGVVNVAGRVEGLQLGVINVAQEVEGASVGLLPIARNGRQQLLFWTTPGTALLNAGVKLRVGPIYSLLGIGYQPADPDASDGDIHYRSSVLPAVGIGGHVELDPLFVDLDVLYQSAHSGDALSDQHNLISLRPQLGLNLTRWFGLFGGLALESGPHQDSFNEHLTLRGLAGVQVF